MTTPPPDQQVAQSETPEQIANRICRHYLDSERVSVTQFCDIEAAILSALRNEREACALAICSLCRRNEDYQAAKRGEDGIWRHARIGHEAEWEEPCKASAIREGR